VSTAHALHEPRENVIEVEGLTVHYGGRRVLADVSLAVREGEIFVIMGGSGSGKSTLLRHMMGLEIPVAGRVRVFGADLAELGSEDAHELRRKMGVAFQSGALFSSMTVGENIMLPLEELAELDRKTMEIMMRLKLELVDLAGFENLMPSELSGGMAKRAAMARAIIMDPKVLFCDEPSAGLDPAISSALDDLILKLREALRMTIVVVTHELESAFKIADRIAVLDEGRLLAVDAPDAIRESPLEPIQNLIQRRPEEVPMDPHAYLRRLTGEA
jgi:phospholipid/cholesterol/gamma-HCH transport system ATP-binding protein